MKCYEKAFIVFQESNKTIFTYQNDILIYMCPEDFFKVHNIKMKSAKCKAEDMNTIEDFHRECIKCWNREF